MNKVRLAPQVRRAKLAKWVRQDRKVNLVPLDKMEHLVLTEHLALRAPQARQALRANVVNKASKVFKAPLAKTVKTVRKVL